MSLYFDEIESPLGPLLLVAGSQGIVLLEFEGDVAAALAGLEQRLGRVELAPRKNPDGHSAALRAYFAGDLHAIDRVPVELRGTPFQKRVWSELRAIPAGATRSYSDLARALGRPTATRAVGMANGRNPVAVIVPCHRVIGANGTLTGYGGGLERKRWLLVHEGALL